MANQFEANLFQEDFGGFSKLSLLSTITPAQAESSATLTAASGVVTIATLVANNQSFDVQAFAGGVTVLIQQLSALAGGVAVKLMSAVPTMLVLTPNSGGIGISNA